MKTKLPRRDFLAVTFASACAINQRLSMAAQGDLTPAGFGFGFSFYGMKQLPLIDALRTCAEIGYDSVEIPTMADWPGAPEKLTAQQRSELRTSLADDGLRLAGIMENVTLLADTTVHAKNLDRLQAAGELGHELSPNEPPVIETIMGGAPANWETLKGPMAERLHDWAAAGEKSKTVIAIKAHVSGAAHRPEHIRWLLDQVNSPWIKAAFDFSHFQLRDIALADAWKLLADDTSFIHIKDSTGMLEKFQFVLPGEGSIDYVSYLQMLHASKCKTDLVVEVSGQIFNRPGYDPVAAAKKSYAPIAEAFDKAVVTRRTLRGVGK